MLDLESFLKKYYTQDEKVILACSTWPDSMFLLYELLKTSYKKNIVACYFNHKIRIESDIEEEFLINFWKINWFQVETTTCYILKLKEEKKSISIEELAREKRYEYFKSILEKYSSDKIILAHHLDDKIETFFFNLSRWSKLTGLINMTEKSWNILRPLLNIEKSEILNYLNTNNLKYFIDETNSDNKITRNLLRNDIIPQFSNINNHFKTHISNTINYLEELKNHIDIEVRLFLSQNKSFFLISEFNSLSSFLQKEIIRYIFFISNWNSTIWLSQANIEEIIKFINGKNNKTIKEIKGLKMKKDWNKIYYI